MNALGEFGSTLIGQWRQAPAPGVFRYLVVDQAALHGIEVAQALSWHGPSRDLLRDAAPDWRTGASPVLLQAPMQALGSRQQRAWETFASRWRYANALTYLESSLPMEALAPALSARLQALLPDNLPVVLRWFDGRVFVALMSTLTPQQREELLKPAHAWWVADRWGNLLGPPYAPAQALLRDSVMTDERVSLDRDQERALLEAGEPDVLIKLLLDQFNAQLLEMLPPEQYVAISALWRDARAAGVTEMPDQLAYCHLGLALGRDFAQEQPWSDVLARARKEKIGFAEALAEVADS